jgi:hypothetical protein
MVATVSLSGWSRPNIRFRPTKNQVCTFALGDPTPKRSTYFTWLRCAGGPDNGAPGLRPEYGPDYYAAFIIDPDGYRIGPGET